MKLDNEQQRALLMQIIRACPISGLYEQAREAVLQLSTLESAVINADIDPPIE